MKTLRQIIIAIIIVCAIGFALVPSKVNAQTLPPIAITDFPLLTYGGYGYLSRYIIVQAFNKKSEEEFPYDQKIALINQLSLDNYFWMKTRQEKLDYIHTHYNESNYNKYLLIVADAEGVHSENYKEVKNDSANYRDEEKKSWAFEKRVEDYQKLWYNTLMPVFKNKPKQITYRQAYFDKRYWPSDARNSLYLYFWPDLKDKNLNATKFTPDEERRLQDAYDIYPSGDIDMTRNVGAAGVIAHMPADNGIIKDWNFYARNAAGGDGQGWTFEWYVNGEMRWKINLSGSDCVALAAGGGAPEAAAEALSWVWLKAAAFKLYRPVLNVGENIATRTMVTGGVKAVKAAASAIYEVSIVALNGIKIKFNTSAIFARSSLSAYIRKVYLKYMDDSINLIAKDLESHGLKWNAEVFRYRWQTFAEKTEVVTNKIMKERCPGASGYYCPWQDKIVLNENVWLSGLSSDIKDTSVHELNHAASAITIGYRESRLLTKQDGNAYCPFEEGLTVFLTLKQTGRKIGLTTPYPNETKVAAEFYNAVLRKKGSTEGEKLVYQIYYTFGPSTESIDAVLLTPGADATINGFLTQGKYSEAITYLRGL